MPYRLVVGLLLLTVPLASAQKTTPPRKPRVVLVGDSIRQGYAPEVARLLGAQATVISPKGAGDSAWLVKELEALIIDHKPDLVHLNVGLHDLRYTTKTKSFQVDLAGYVKNLDVAVRRLRELKIPVILATTTPIDDARHARRKAGYDRHEKTVQKYNEALLRVAAAHSLVVHDLHALVTEIGPDKIMTADGTHYTAEGKTRQAVAVADCLQRNWLLIEDYKKWRAGERKPAPGKQPDADPAATAAYKKEEARRDALVPEAFRKLPIGKFKQPVDAAEWKRRRPEVLEIVRKSLGDLPRRPRPSSTLISREIRNGFILENRTIPNGVDGEMSAFLLMPEKRKGKSPAILWLHSSSYDRHQLLQPGYNGGDEPLAEVYAKAGYVVLAPDACWYGGRAGVGPSGKAEETRTQQESLLKYNLWFGRTLWGMFVHDDQVALDYLCTRPEVDVKRIGATGISMGSTRSWWLAAVDERIACAVGVSCLTRYQNLIAHGQLRQHGVYYFVNGPLKHFDVEGVIALIAPRPFLALTGDLDAGSPADGVLAIEEEVGKVYRTLGARANFRSVLYKDTGHVYTEKMRREMLDWFARHLKVESERKLERSKVSGVSND